MNKSWTLKDLGITVLFSFLYFAIVLAATIMGAIHPVLYLFVSSLVALLAWLPYFYITSKEQKAGVIFIMNLFVALGFMVFGELANLLLVSLIACSIVAEIIRKAFGYEDFKGLVVSYIIFIFGNIGSPLYVWIYPQYAVSEATEEMSAAYAETLSGLTSVGWMVAVILVTIMIGVITGHIAKRVFRKQLNAFGVA